jgi:excisionase family DNA binding protein
MSLLMLLLGIVLFFTGRIQLGTLRAAGRHVKAAGVILTLPALLSLLFVNFFIPFALGANQSAVNATVGVVAALELVGMIIAGGIAYVLLADPPGAPRLPGFLGELQDEARKQSSAGAQVPPPPNRNKTVVIPMPKPTAPAAPRRQDFPSVMNLKQAARYLQKSEAEVLKLIEEGKLTAARDNFNYKIAKSQLDELLL